jgi:hypothetical protein
MRGFHCQTSDLKGANVLPVYLRWGEMKALLLSPDNSYSTLTPEQPQIQHVHTIFIFCLSF